MTTDLALVTAEGSNQARAVSAMITQLVIMGQRGSISSGGSSSNHSSRTRARPTDKPGHIGGLAALPFACVLAARSPVEGTRAGSAEPEISPVTAIQMLGQIGLSLGPEILAFESDSGADTRYRDPQIDVGDRRARTGFRTQPAVRAGRDRFGWQSV